MFLRISYTRGCIYCAEPILEADYAYPKMYNIRKVGVSTENRAVDHHEGKMLGKTGQTSRHRDERGEGWTSCGPGTGRAR